MARISVSEAAAHLGVNVQRIHQRIADGSLPAERVGRQWVIDEADLVRLDRHPAGRPLSPRSAWVLAAVAALEAASPPSSYLGARIALAQAVDDPLANIAPSERSRARARLRDLLSEAMTSKGRRAEDSTAADLAATLRALLRRRAERHLFRASPRDLADLRTDARVNLSGMSLRDSGIASADIVEAYVAEPDLPGVIRDYLLSGARPSEANVVLHVVDPTVAPDLTAQQHNWLVLAADLAEYHRPREVARAAEIIREIAERHPALVSEPR